MKEGRGNYKYNYIVWFKHSWTSILPLVQDYSRCARGSMPWVPRTNWVSPRWLRLIGYFQNLFLTIGGIGGPIAEWTHTIVGSYFFWVFSRWGVNWIIFLVDSLKKKVFCALGSRVSKCQFLYTVQYLQTKFYPKKNAKIRQCWHFNWTKLTIRIWLIYTQKYNTHE